MTPPCLCRRYIPPASMEDVSTVMEPTPFAEMFGESEDLFDVRCCAFHCWHSCDLHPLFCFSLS